MDKNQNNKKSSGAQITSSLLLSSLNDESIQRIMAENLQIEDLCAFAKIGQKLKECAEARLEEKFRDYYVSVDGYYADYGIKLDNLKKFAPYIRNIRIMGMGYQNGKQIATFIESHFRNVKSIELKFVSITHHLKNLFKNVDTIIFNTCQNDTDFCYHDDCLKYCERLRCLRFAHFGISEEDEDKFNAIMTQKYAGLEKVQIDIRYTPNMMRNWERFVKQNTGIKSLALRFLNDNEKFVLKVIKPVVDNALNLEELFLYLDLDKRYTGVFNFGVIHEQLAILDKRRHHECIGITVGNHYSYFKNLDLCASLKSLKLLEINHYDPCNIVQDISKYSNNVKTLTFNSFISSCPLGDHRMLMHTWNYNFLNLEVLHFWRVTNAYFLIPLFIRHSPTLKKIIARACKIVLEKNVKMSMKKFNDERAKVCSSSCGELIIYSDQQNIQSNYQFDLVKLKQIDFEDCPFNEFNPPECFIEDKVGLSVFHSNEDEIRRMREMDRTIADADFLKNIAKLDLVID